jgi:hypothetical protein
VLLETRGMKFRRSDNHCKQSLVKTVQLFLCFRCTEGSPQQWKFERRSAFSAFFLFGMDIVNTEVYQVESHKLFSSVLFPIFYPDQEKCSHVICDL